MSRIATLGENLDVYEVLRKKLVKAGTFENVRNIASRLFQRAPLLVEKMEEEISDDWSRQRKKAEMIERILETIRLLVSESKENREYNMPVKLSNYVTYVDLLLGIEKASSKEWVVNLLIDYPEERKVPDLIENEGYRLRSSLKASLKGLSLVPSVQAETKDDRVWLWVAVVKKTTNRSKDETKLSNARAAMVVYFPGEPYFYSTLGMRDEVGDALSSCLGCHGWEQLGLRGKHVNSLRRMRLGRDARDGPVRARPGRDRFAMCGEVIEETPSLEQPCLERGKWILESELKGSETLSRPEEWNVQQKVRTSLVVTGKDVVSGLLALSAAGILDSPTPRWVTNFATSGRNEFVLDAAAARVLVAKENEDWDRFSHISTRSRATLVMEN